jgi:DNA polymerase-1
MKTVLLVDANYVCSRAWYATGQLMHEGKATGMALGVIQTLERCRERFGTDGTVLAFDCGVGERRFVRPEYKANRREGLTEEQKASKREYLRQLRRIPGMLRYIGYRNIFSQRGFEADDVVASAAGELTEEQSGVIVSGDSDLWQLIRHNVVCYAPVTKKVLDREAFMIEWGLPPEMWAQVKALAGDPTDNVEGIKGVGLKTAARYYKGELKEGSKIRQRIEQNLDVVNKNLELIRLPFRGTKRFELREDELDPRRRKRVFEKLGADLRRWS